jgi:FKBP12-rapamycin complex-associated protein
MCLQVRSLIHSLLVRIGRHHPQALMYPLLVAAKSQSPSRRQAAYAVLDVVRTHSATLVEQAQVRSRVELPGTLCCICCTGCGAKHTAQRRHR